MDKCSLCVFVWLHEEKVNTDTRVLEKQNAEMRSQRNLNVAILRGTGTNHMDVYFSFFYQI